MITYMNNRAFRHQPAAPYGDGRRPARTDLERPAGAVR
jgi:hypothetical protein